MTILTVIEQSELDAKETIIRTGLKSFIQVGEALSYIRDEKLYKEFGTFEEYCQKRWGMSRRFINYQIQANEIVENLGTIVPAADLPQIETHARPLAQLPPEQQQLAWQEVVESGNKITAKEVQKVVDQVKQADPPKKDKTEIKITNTHVVKNFYSLSEWQNLTSDMQSILLSKNGNSSFNPTNDNIEWARYSWNPITGCLHNCPYCYARDIANRFYTQKFEPSFYPERLTAPANTKRKDLEKFDSPVDKIGYRNVFVCSMSDLFGKWVHQEWIEAVLKQIKDNPQWTFLLLSKFPIRMAEFEYPDNVWLGTSVDYQWAVQRAEKAFTKIKASGFNGVCWLSCEPMMERLTFDSLNMFDWVVIGGSSRSTQTPEYFPPFDDIVHLHNQARESNCKIYHKTNLIKRVREYPE